MKTLNDTQRVLLSAAAARDNGSVIPFRETLTAPANLIGKAISSLLKAMYVGEREVQDAATAWRQDGDNKIGLQITDAGRTAIGVDVVGFNLQLVPPQALVDAPAPKSQTKTAMVLGMLQRNGGATLAELITATGWLPHTTRAALTGLRKSHKIEKCKRCEETLYRIASAG